MSKTVARRYAKALFEVASEQKQIDAVEKDLKQITDTLEAFPGIDGMAQPSFNRERTKKGTAHQNL